MTSAAAPPVIPEELRAHPQWVVWRWEPDPDNPTKRRKPPYQAKQPDRLASCTNPETWATFEQAVSAVEAGKADGIGFALGPPYVGIDLDEELPEVEQHAIMLALDSYSETSPSGRGHHVILKASLNGHGRHPQGIGVFQDARFFYCTGEHVHGTPLEIMERQEQLERVLAEYLPCEPSQLANGVSQVVLEDDHRLLDKAMCARNGAAFRRLWDGDPSGHASRSEADLALCGMLAFWTGRDPERIDRLFRASRRMREKWERADYRERTIAAALEGRTAFYEPGRRDPREPFALPAQPKPRLRGLMFSQAIKEPIPKRNEIVENLIDTGTLGQIAGLPFARKTFLANEIAHKVAAGAGLVLGRYPIATAGPVIYVWQDDSTAKELERIQAYAERHDYPDTLPLRFVLNEGVQLPDDLDELRTLIEQDAAVLIVLDSLYNFLPASVGLKEEAVAAILADVKREICDRTGCTVAIVDHAPWPTEGNRGQRRGYGSVFKTAAVRWVIHLETERDDDKRLQVEASGNNVAGFRRAPAYFDENTYEIRLLDIQRVDEEELDERVLDYLTEHAWTSTKGVKEGVKGRADSIGKSLVRLQQAGTLTSGSSRDLGLPGHGTYWNTAQEAGSEVVPLFGTTPDHPTPGCVTNRAGVPEFPPPTGGTPAPGPPSSDADDHSQSTDRRPVVVIGDPGYPILLGESLHYGHITKTEHRERLDLHGLLVNGRRS